MERERLLEKKKLGLEDPKGLQLGHSVALVRGR